MTENLKAALIAEIEGQSARQCRPPDCVGV